MIESGLLPERYVYENGEDLNHFQNNSFMFIDKFSRDLFG